MYGQPIFLTRAEVNSRSDQWMTEPELGTEFDQPKRFGVENCLWGYADHLRCPPNETGVSV